MSIEITKDRIKKHRMIAILRGDFRDTIETVTDALIRGGVTVMEITLNSPDALILIKKLVNQYGNTALIGAGTVLSVDDVLAVADAGGQFIVSPDTYDPVIQATHDCDMVSIPGAYTATEVMQAHRAGADFVKLFPVSNGGISYFKSVRAPLNSIEIIPTGGISPTNITDYLKNGAVAVGAASQLIPSSFDGSDKEIQSIHDNALAFRRALSKL